MYVFQYLKHSYKNQFLTIPYFCLSSFLAVCVFLCKHDASEEKTDSHSFLHTDLANKANSDSKVAKPWLSLTWVNKLADLAISLHHQDFIKWL